MTGFRKKIYTNLDVVTAARERIKNIFANDCEIVFSVSGREPLLSKLGGRVPVVIVDHADESEDVYGTITHNRARGTHQLEPMKAIIKKLIDNGKTVKEIGKQLGMRPEEVFRLSDLTRNDFLAIMAKGHEYGKAYNIVKVK